jgi:hypothetical protein
MRRAFMVGLLTVVSVAASDLISVIHGVLLGVLFAVAAAVASGIAIVGPVMIKKSFPTIR